ncbi:putative toxin-antitoxin system toxin component, PIN family [Mucilaginibacter sp.]|uniref:putative toxin-antitoxin system toxin component, PIN family n=1 Tax=Mucilaginibacter sp. TaxID=1882438 RepID=UPI00326544DC
MIELFVFDTNSLISAYLLRNSISRQALRMAIKKGILVHSPATFGEFVETFCRPKFDKYLPLSERLDSIADLEQTSQFMTVSININACRDPKDNKFLELAVTSKAACLITGDKDLLVLNPFNGIPIVTAAEFLLL